MQKQKENECSIFSNLYVSEGRDEQFINELHEMAHNKTGETSDCALVNKFSDPHYNRTSFCFAGHYSSVSRIIKEVAEVAIESLNLEEHEASHPRIGVVDHISVHPLGETMVFAEEAAREIGAYFGTEKGIPILFYGSLNGKRLSAVRRSTSYFRGGQDREVAADLGPRAVNPRRGAMCVGAVPPVLNYNVRFRCTDRKAVGAIARALREKDGGLPGVEAVALRHAGGNYEAACNLLEADRVGPEEVLAAATAAAAAQGGGIEVDAAYTIGLTAAEVTDRLARALAGRCSGGGGGDR